MRQEALLVLVGITAGRYERRQVLCYLSRQSDYAVFVPPLFYRAGIQVCAAWLSRYLDNTVKPARFGAVHAIVFIAGGLLLRCLEPDSLPTFERLVQIRGPIQEQVAAALVRRLGRVMAGWLGGRAVIDLADGWPQSLPLPSCARQHGLVIELGRSRMARLLGITWDDADDWTPEYLLPGATDVLQIPQSHDDVYTFEPVLDAALQFIRTGRFPTQGVSASNK